MKSRTTKIRLQRKSSYALHHQVKLGQYDFPFTLNPTTGCFFGCTYCYSPWVVYERKRDRKKRFFETIHVKLDKPQRLAKELTRYSKLPQNMKRVQINETSEYYLPQLLKHLDDNRRPDLMLDILDEFESAWQNGNKWMLHILTKSHLILNHIEKLKAMKHMVQIEVSFATMDEKVRRRIEFFTTSIDKRLDLVESLAKAGLFVRIMAMPFYGESNDLQALKDETFRRGAKAFKNKGLNYYKWADLDVPRTFEEFIKERIPRSTRRTDTKNESFIIKSGEQVLINGEPQEISVRFPRVDKQFRAKKNWSAMSKFKQRSSIKKMNVIDCGYRDCNSVDWGYII